MTEKTERMMTISPNLDCPFRAGFGIIDAMLMLEKSCCVYSVLSTTWVALSDVILVRRITGNKSNGRSRIHARARRTWPSRIDIVVIAAWCPHVSMM
jgi:hypothetical protein